MKRPIWRNTMELRNYLKIHTIFGLVFCLAVSLAFLAQEASGAASGGQPGQFLAWGAGARSLGMGKAFYAVSDDASATYWNPAGLTQMDRRELMALHVNLFADTMYDFISYVHPTPKLGIFGANLTRLYSGGFEKIEISYDENKEDIIDIRSVGTFDDVQMALTTAYGKRIKDNMSLGASAKYITHTLDTSTNGFITFDVAVLVEGINHRFANLQLGFGVQNLLSSKFGDTDDVLPLILRFGASHPFLRNKLLLAFDLDKNLKANMGWHIGAEYWVINFAALRIGFEGEQGIRETTAGFGVKYKDYGLDYSFALHDLGLSHRLSGSWRFGPSVTQNREALVRRYIQEGMEAYRQGNFLLAFSRLETALDVDPGNKDVKRMFSRIQVITGFLQAAAGESEEAVSIRKGVGAYVESDDKTAINAFRYAYYKNPQNIKLLALLNRIEKELGINQTDAYKEDVVGFTIIDQKVFDSRQAIIEGKYDQALIKCQEILNLEPANITAMEIMGSAFFMMDQPDKAKQVWMKVMELDPTNKVVPEFISQLEQR
ncbi:MAG: PorV/PorQ family protein [Endomicrobiales bacterium]|nr:PorV/PorQ family protein [Endomicrobiales bacterium]